MRSDSIVERIKEKADVVEIIRRTVSLKRSGKSWSGLCPFHKETDGSFHIYEDSGNFICFGCGVSGDVIKFYEMYYKLDFIEACEKLCRELGIDWQRGGSFSADKGRDALYEANKLAGKLYYDAIKTEDNPALSYLLGRGIDRKTISRFRIGYADDSGRALAQRVEDDAAMQKAAEEVGLVYRYSGRLRDRFEGRVMFPIMNMRGMVIGFGGRDISGTAKAKYINSAGSRVFVKGANLYGLYITRNAIREQGSAILVEGYMDLVALGMHGITNVCAQLGTAFTAEQAKLLGKYTKNVTLALDSDESGQSAALKTMDILAAAGMKVRVIVLEGAKDPDDFVRAFGPAAWYKAVDDAMPMVDFKLKRLEGGFNLETWDGRADFLKAATQMVSRLSPIDRDYYIKRLSREYEIAEDAIALYAESSKESAPSGRKRAELQERPSGRSDALCRAVLAVALGSADALEKAAAFRHLFDETDYSGIMNAMLMLKNRNGVPPTIAELSETLDEADLATLDLIVREAETNPGGACEAQIGEYLIKLELADLRARENKLKETASLGENDMDLGALEELKALLNRIKSLENAIRNGKRGG